jgi:hypothetical protein
VQVSASVRQSGGKTVQSLFVSALGVAATVALVGCVSQKGYVYSSIDNPVKLGSSPYHRFEVVRVYADQQQLVVYGKVSHAHGDCAPAAHVDLAIVDDRGKPVFKRSLPLIDRGTRRRGWAGAAFRTRAAPRPQPGQRVVLEFHDHGCAPAAAFDCGENMALAKLSKSP